VLVVDSSDTDSSQRITEKFAEQSGLEVKYVRAAPRKTVQLNLALDLLDASTDIVHFTDDDVILDPEYLRDMLAAFQSHPECGGVGGRVSKPPKQRAKGLVKLYRRAFLLDSKNQGVLLRSGMNVLCRTGHQPRKVDWLSGCSMSYRTSAIAGLRFDETRAGNGMGEDVDFSARVAERACLIWTPQPVIDHRESPINREDDLVSRRRAIRSWWRLAVLGIGSVSRLAVLYAVLGDTLMLLIMAGVFRSRRYLRQAFANGAGIVDALKGTPV
jgi:GT2 family glycosyltransferase